MKIAIFSDTHLGFGKGTEREQDSFTAFEEAVQKSLQCDAILIAGDIFDTKEPGSESLALAISILSKTKSVASPVKLSSKNKDLNSLNPLCMQGIPVIMLAGNHERKAKGFANPVQSLEKAGFAIHLNAQSITLSKGPDTATIHGLSAIPDQFFQQALKQWSPSPVPENFNILAVHQIFSEFAFSASGLSMTSLPPGFDLYIDGDIHEPALATLHKKPVLICGSTIATQIKKDSPRPKIHILQTQTGNIDSVELETPRQVYYFDLRNAKIESIESELERALSKPHKSLPIIRLVAAGQSAHVDETIKKYSQKALISIRAAQKEPAFQTTEMQTQKLTVQEAGRELLEVNLQKAGLDVKTFLELFEILQEADKKKAEQFLESFHVKPEAEK